MRNGIKRPQRFFIECIKCTRQPVFLLVDVLLLCFGCMLYVVCCMLCVGVDRVLSDCRHKAVVQCRGQRCQYCRALRSWIFVVFMDGLFGVFSWVKIFHGNVIHGKSVSFYFVFIWIVVFGDFFLQRGFFPPGKTKIHGKKIHSKIPWIYRTHPKIFVSKKMKYVTV